MRFVLPLPDNRQELVNLLTLEMDAELESQAGAMNRLGVENVSAKKQERRMARPPSTRSPYRIALTERRGNINRKGSRCTWRNQTAE